MTTQIAKKNLKIRTPLDPSGYDPHEQLVVKNLADHEELETTPLPLEIS